jgi:hypothetical protein
LNSSGAIGEAKLKRSSDPCDFVRDDFERAAFAAFVSDNSVPGWCAAVCPAVLHGFLAFAIRKIFDGATVIAFNLDGLQAKLSPPVPCPSGRVHADSMNGSVTFLDELAGNAEDVLGSPADAVHSRKNEVQAGVCSSKAEVLLDGGAIIDLIETALDFLEAVQKLNFLFSSVGLNVGFLHGRAVVFALL